MIREEICTYEVCKLAKEKGFPQDVFGTCEMKSSCYVDDGRFYKDGCICPIEDAYTAPTQSLLQRWLREEKGIIVEVIAYPTCSNNKKNCYWWSIKQNSDGICYQYEECSDTLYGFSFAFDTYELALEDALKYALKNLLS